MTDTTTQDTALAAILAELRKAPAPVNLPVPVPVAEVKGPGLEKHIQTIMVAAILALGMWLFQSTNASQSQLAVLATNVAGIQAKLTELSQKLDERNTTDTSTAARIADHEARIVNVEGLAARLRDRSSLPPPRVPAAPEGN